MCEAGRPKRKPLRIFAELEIPAKRRPAVIKLNNPYPKPLTFRGFFIAERKEPMQDIQGKPIKLNGKPAGFTVKDFTATNFATAENKAKLANKLPKFILGGFQKGDLQAAAPHVWALC
jgi:hypothetical protein